jgi:acetolactate synthase-1/2/3 large subunit
MKVSDYIIDTLVKHNVKHVFMLSGGGAMHLNDSLGRRRDEIGFVCNLHEQAVGIAAEAYARVTNGFGVAMVTSGPGSTNAITGLVGAWLDSTRCIFLSGQVKTPDLKTIPGHRQNGVQEVDIVSMVRTVTKYAVTLVDPATVRYEVEKAIYLANLGRPGPVWIDVPLDVQAVQIDPENLPGFTPPPAPSVNGSIRAQVAQAIELLNQSARPILLLGNGIRVAGAADKVQSLVETLAVPAVTTWLGLDLIPDAHPLFVGRPGGIAPRGANFAVQNCDCLLVIGSRLDLALTGYAHEKFARAAKKIMVDIDPAEIQKMKMKIDLPIVADAGVFIDELIAHSKLLHSADRKPWIDKCFEWKSRYPLLRPEHLPAAGDKLSMYYFSECLWDALDEGELVVPGSSGFASEIFFLMTKAKAGQRIFHNRGTGSMGFAIPSAIGACFAAGRKRTISVDGDGGFQMNIQELATISQHRLPIKFFVVNNGGYASIRSSQLGYFKGNLTGADATSGVWLPDLGKVAAAYEIPFRRITVEDDLKSLLPEILDAPGPIVCEVMVRHDEPRIPRLASTQLPDGRMVSKPLEDLFPFLDREEFLSNMLIPPLEE